MGWALPERREPERGRRSRGRPVASGLPARDDRDPGVHAASRATAARTSRVERTAADEHASATRARASARTSVTGSFCGVSRAGRPRGGARGPRPKRLATAARPSGAGIARDRVVEHAARDADRGEHASRALATGGHTDPGEPQHRRGPPRARRVEAVAGDERPCRPQRGEGREPQPVAVHDVGRDSARELAERGDERGGAAGAGPGARTSRRRRRSPRDRRRASPRSPPLQALGEQRDLHLHAARSSVGDDQEHAWGMRHATIVARTTAQATVAACVSLRA